MPVLNYIWLGDTGEYTWTSCPGDYMESHQQTQTHSRWIVDTVHYWIDVHFILCDHEFDRFSCEGHQFCSDQMWKDVDFSGWFTPLLSCVLERLLLFWKYLSAILFYLEGVRRMSMSVHRIRVCTMAHAGISSMDTLAPVHQTMSANDVKCLWVAAALCSVIWPDSLEWWSVSVDDSMSLYAALHFICTWDMIGRCNDWHSIIFANMHISLLRFMMVFHNIGCINIK